MEENREKLYEEQESHIHIIDNKKACVTAAFKRGGKRTLSDAFISIIKQNQDQ